MSEKESAIDNIYFKLQKSKTLHSLMEPVLESPDQQRLRDFRKRFGDSRMARSDELVDPTDNIILNFKVDNLRNGIFKVGHPSNTDPLYREWVKEGLITAEDAHKFFFVKGKGMVIKAELDSKDESLGNRLAITSREPDRLVDLGVDFLNGYWLTIEYSDPSNPNYAEYQAYNFLSEMTGDELSIFSDYIKIARTIIDEKA